ncbi:CesD/SycD/LcrH family type III secretion system chaperone [Bordetella genomosp. 1]|uniref:CesD/SycD/LcrH family type III secretion system chaperone n=1 Tax=Bordetella genomosp. 1 TaxID=1395607 RepID=A0A261S6X8_9BORD|nr:SycD/LcrH family type III secretion system chaperone [Bordetella genomosp. 1]MDQ8033438.1 SycD/LcrH family type III secretion system chaperone [Bordetella sp.]OZI33086.1 CesD/SycD/LcrH family type III secretion system chaperone [Bordetella genomosp. 1]OZI57191.1 CesD/SycD/LcrH family type III secretion system chaperone [Bordetella genomosp. 1]
MSTAQQTGMTSEEYGALHDQIVAQFARGGSLGELNGMTADECEALYSLGYGLYEKGRYPDALKVLSYLVALNHTEHRYLVALGAAAQALGKHADALQQYMAATLLDPLEPAPAFYAAQCLTEMGQFDTALQSCDLVLSMARPDVHAVLIDRTQALRSVLVSRGAKEKQA